jgi:hypothetical protein
LEEERVSKRQNQEKAHEMVVGKDPRENTKLMVPVEVKINHLLKPLNHTED